MLCLCITASEFGVEYKSVVESRNAIPLLPEDLIHAQCLKDIETTKHSVLVAGATLLRCINLSSVSL